MFESCAGFRTKDKQWPSGFGNGEAAVHDSVVTFNLPERAFLGTRGLEGNVAKNGKDQKSKTSFGSNGMIPTDLLVQLGKDNIITFLRLLLNVMGE